MITAGPCESWEPIVCCDLTASDAVITGYAAQAATEVLWALSGRRFGTCSVTLLPCPRGCEPPSAWYWGDSHWPQPALVGGLWYNLPCNGSCPGSCTCNTESAFEVPRPISSIVSITVDGVVVPTGSYRVANYRTVVRTDGVPWPSCNDGTWTATVRYGEEVPTLGLLAAGELTCEFVKACENVSTCKLPSRVQTLTRQGVTMAFLDPQEFLKDGLTGLYLPDLFISSVNPNKLQSPSQVYSPDLPMPRTWTS